MATKPKKKPSKPKAPSKPTNSFEAGDLMVLRSAVDVYQRDLMQRASTLPNDSMLLTGFLRAIDRVGTVRFKLNGVVQP